LPTIQEFDPGNDRLDTLFILAHRLAKGHNIAIGKKGICFGLQRFRKPLPRFTDMSSVM
jgi:hypothetical protein